MAAIGAGQYSPTTSQFFFLCDSDDMDLLQMCIPSAFTHNFYSTTLDHNVVRYTETDVFE